MDSNTDGITLDALTGTILATIMVDGMPLDRVNLDTLPRAGEWIEYIGQVSGGHQPVHMVQVQGIWHRVKIISTSDVGDWIQHAREPNDKARAINRAALSIQEVIIECTSLEKIEEEIQQPIDRFRLWIPARYGG